MSQVNDQTYACTLFSLTPVASAELNQVLNIEQPVVPHVPLHDIASCSHVPESWITYLNVDLTTLTDIFRGNSFNLTYPGKPHTMLLCDPNPTVVIRPVGSIYGNRMFLTAHGSEWFDFLLQFAATFSGEMIEKLYVNTLEGTLPPHILDMFVIKAQSLVNVSMFGNVNTQEIVDAIFKNVDTILSQRIFKTTGLAFQAFGVVLQLSSVIHSPNALSISSLVFNLLKDCAVEFVLIQKVIDFLSPYYKEFVEYVARPRAQLDVGDLTDGVKEYITPESVCKIFSVISVTVITAVAAKKLPDKSSVNNAMKFASTLGRAITGATGAIAVLSTIALPVFDKIYEYVVGVPRDLQGLSGMEAEVADFISSVNKLYKDGLDSYENLRDDLDIQNRLLTLRTLGATLNKRLLGTKCSARAYRIFERYYLMLEKLIDKAELIGGKGTGPRPEPLVVQLFGKSGTGKSHVPYFIAADLCSWEDKEGDPINHMYYRKTDNEYFDGYKPGTHLMCVYDDFGQVKDSKSKPNTEFLELIYACNIAEYALHMADIKEKNNTYFNSKLILLTTNHCHYKIDSLTEPEAFLRRVDLRFEVSINPLFKDKYGNVCPELVKSHPSSGGREVSEVVYQFTPYSRTRGQGNNSQYEPIIDSRTLNPVVLDYESFIQLVKSSYNKKINHSHARINAMAYRAQQLREKKENASFVDAPVAQVDADDHVQFLICYYIRSGLPEDLYDIDISQAETDKLALLYNATDTMWHFIDEVSDACMDYKFTPLEGRGEEAFKLASIAVESYENAIKGPHGVDAESAKSAKTIVDSIRDYAKRLSEKPIWQHLTYLGSLITGALALWKIYDLFKPRNNAVGRSFNEGTVLVGSEAVSGDVVTSARPTVRVEHSSGDVVTAGRVNARVESSGDVVTAGRVNARVEHQSGDVVTKAKDAARVEGILSEAYTDINTQEILQSAIISNAYQIGGEGSNFAANILFIRGTSALCNWHVWDFMKQHKTICLRNLNLKVGYAIPYDKVEVIPITLKHDSTIFKDAVILQFPNVVRLHKDIVKHFVRSIDISRFAVAPGLLAGLATTGKNLVYRVEPLKNIKAYDELKYTYMDCTRKSHTLHVRSMYGYAAQTGAGDCGSALLLNTTAIPRKICGIHAAGQTGYGYATSITYEDLMRCLPESESRSEILAHCLHACVNDSTKAMITAREAMPEGDFIPIGICSEPKGSPGKSNIRKSPLYGLIEKHESYHLPSVLRPIVIDDVLVDPMYLGLKKCGITPTYIDEGLVETARASFAPVIMRNTDERFRRLLTYEEAITGVSELEFMNPINRRSSPGFGWDAGSTIGKTKWLGDDEYVLDNIELKNAVERRESLAKQGIRDAHLWVDTLKVERRPIAKVRQGKTRVFSVGQMDYCLLFRKYFLGFNGHVMFNRIHNEVAVGINAYSYEWNVLGKHLNKVGGKVIAGDFANYDGTLNPQIMYACLDIINDWYDDGEENQLVRRVLFEELVASIHLCGDVVYQWTHSQPSGNPLTTILNSMYNSISMRIVYQLLNLDISKFQKNVSMISYGDDNVVNISDGIIDCFNQTSISHGYSLIGMCYTDESKGEESVGDYRSIDQVEFLKRSFRLDRGVYYAPLELRVILEMIYWVKGDLDHDELCLTNCETAFRELSLHEKSIYLLWTKRIMRAARSQNLYPTLYSYEHTQHLTSLSDIYGKMNVIQEDIYDCTEIKAQVLDTNNETKMQPVTELVAPADPVATNEPQQVTQWVDDAAKQSTSLPKPVVPSRDVLAPGMESREHNIIDILERPVKIGSFVWSDTNTFDTEIASYDFPESIITSSTNVADKIDHFTFLRAHVEVRFVVNANTFQAGRLVAYFAPFSKSEEIGNRFDVNNYMSAKTVFPRVVLDAGSGNVGELLIPYVSYYTHYDLARGIGDLGTVRISVLNPLQSGTADVTVFARFKEISLQIPTAAPNSFSAPARLVNDFKREVFSSSDISNPRFRRAIREAVMKAKNDATTEERYGNDDDLPRAQVGESQMRAESGVVTRTLNTVAGISSFAASLPIVGKFAAPVEWISRAGAQVASYFGLSKTGNLVPLNKMVQIPGYGFTNVDGIDNSLVLGSSIENEIGTRFDLFGSGLDEMDITYICQHESYLTSFKWDGSKVPGDVLFKTVVSPTALAYDDVNPPVFRSTAMGYVGSMFRYWRGGLKYKIQVTKTAYHSGRLRISFIPSGNLGLLGYDYNQGYSEIVDLRTSDEIEFTIPFVSNTLWKSCSLERFDNPSSYVSTTGILVVEVINGLRYPDTVTDSLDCNVWVSGADDIQFSIPDFGRNAPVRDMPTAQVLGQFQDTGFNQAMSNENCMFEAPKTSPVDASATSIGEHVQNLRQVIKRFGVDALKQSVTDTVALRAVASWFGEPRDSNSPATNVNLCPLDYVSWLFRFYRGGIRYKGFVTPTAIGSRFGAISDPGVDVAPEPPSVGFTGLLTYLNNNAGNYRHYIDTIYNRIIEVSTPFYSNTHINLLRGRGALPEVYGDRTTRVLFTGTGDIDLYRAAADDFSFGWLVGPPKLIKVPIAEVATLEFGTASQVGLVTDPGVNTTFNVYNINYTAPAGFGSIAVNAFAPTPIVGTTATSFDLVTSVGTISIPFDSCGVYGYGSSTCVMTFTADIDKSATINYAATLASIQAQGTKAVQIDPAAYGTPVALSATVLDYTTVTGVEADVDIIKIFGVTTTPNVSGYIYLATGNIPLKYNAPTAATQGALVSGFITESGNELQLRPSGAGLDATATLAAINALATSSVSVDTSSPP